MTYSCADQPNVMNVNTTCATHSPSYGLLFLTHLEFIKDQYKWDSHATIPKYWCIVVRMPQTEINAAEFTVEFYSSETNEWRETVISHSLGFSFTTYALSPSVAHIRMVYWLDYRGILIGVDPFNNFNTTIDTTANSGEICVSRAFEDVPFRFGCKPHSESDTDILCVWELKEAEDDQQVDGIAGKLKNGAC
ncbi:hypothetical protein DVH24_032879 [Malus domestica]|uniref:Uncharacterized protein n=1 Tax=Malus domestica TaxID=3750 RepID=A0A498IR28_MALDO|nr:hypothetical protein DVH24_032879 [Malus domestica]